MICCPFSSVISSTNPDPAKVKGQYATTITLRSLKFAAIDTTTYQRKFYPQLGTTVTVDMV